MLKKFVFSFFMIIVLASIAITPVFAGEYFPPDRLPPVSDGKRVNETPNRWFIRLKGSPVAEGNSLMAISTEQDRFRADATAQGISYTENYQYSTLWNGLSITASTKELGKISRIPGVIAIYPVSIIRMPETTQSAYNPDLYTALYQSGAKRVQDEFGFTGKGIKVAVMDTGIDYDHTAFGGDGRVRANSKRFPNSRVIAGWDFVGDAYNADINATIVPDQYPDDCAGHGTHVAGIIGANDKVSGLKGVAPDVQFGAYRVFGCEGSTGDDIMLAAMERAYKDHMQVLNMSIGSPFDWPNAPTAVAASLLVTKGMVVVASIGNSGANGIYSAGAPGLGENVIGVASFDNAYNYLSFFKAKNRNFGYLPMDGSAAIPTSGTGVIVSVVSGVAGPGCDALTAGSLTGKVALVARGGCTFGTKAGNAINAGAKAVIISNNSMGVFSGTLGGSVSKPVIGISLVDGDFLRAQTSPVTLTWTNKSDYIKSDTGGLISSFSSYGLSPDLVLKPDIGAPGGNIYSTWPLEQGGFATLSGTSMSSPHVAGTAALLLQAKPGTVSTKVRTLLQNTAVPGKWAYGPLFDILDKVESVNRQGAGMVRIDRAITAKSMVEPSKLSLGDSMNIDVPTAFTGTLKTIKKTLKITNNNGTTMTYDLSYFNALSTRGVLNLEGWDDSNTKVTFSVNHIKIPAHAWANVTATFTAPTNIPDNSIYGGYIVVYQQGGLEYRVPFAGFSGDYQGIRSMTDAIVLDQDDNLPSGPFSLVGADVPYLWFHLDHQPRIFKAMAVNASTGAVAGKIIQLDYFYRNSSSGGYYALGWDGSVMTPDGGQDVEDGIYKIRISVLKALGDPSKPADWESWTSDVFTITRP